MFNRLEMTAVSFGILGLGNMWAAVTCPPGKIQNIWFLVGLCLTLTSFSLAGLATWLEKRAERQRTRNLQSSKD